MSLSSIVCGENTGTRVQFDGLTHHVITITYMATFIFMFLNGMERCRLLPFHDPDGATTHATSTCRGGRLLTTRSPVTTEQRNSGLVLNSEMKTMPNEFIGMERNAALIFLVATREHHASMALQIPYGIAYVCTYMYTCMMLYVPGYVTDGWGCRQIHQPCDS